MSKTLLTKANISILQLVDFVSMNRAALQDDRRTDKGLHRIAWAFLKIVGNNNKINTGRYFSNIYASPML